MKEYNHYIRAQYFRNAWLWKTGRAEDPFVSFEELEKTEWNKEFERLMKNRLIVGAMRYGKIGNPKDFDRITSIEKRTQKYKNDPNKELLVDIANLCLLEYTEGEGYWKPLEETPRVPKK